MYNTIGFIGTGNMGSAIATAVVKSGRFGTLYLANRTRSKADELKTSLLKIRNNADVRVVENTEIAKSCSLIFLCVKPQMMKEMLDGIRSTLTARNDRPVLCTMAGGMSIATLIQLSGIRQMLRIMPNTPASIGAGIIQYCGKNVTDQELAELREILKPAGAVVPLEERLIDAASCVSGCGPAWAYMFAEALADGGVACGLPREQALAFAAGMLKGAAQMIDQSYQHPGALKDAVCSPGGATIQGVRVLEERGFRGAVIDAVIAAYEKTTKMGS